LNLFSSHSIIYPSICPFRPSIPFIIFIFFIRCCVLMWLVPARVVMTQGSTLNLFSSREAEYEQRAQLLKRLTFTIFCSEIDQYQRHMPDIQGTVVVNAVDFPWQFLRISRICAQTVFTHYVN